MSTGDLAVRARRYLLGEATEDECTAIEEQYFGQPDALEAIEAIEAVEEQLIEDDLDGRLSPEERGRMESHYLRTPEHLVRVEAIRRLKMAARSALTAVPISAGPQPSASAPRRMRVYQMLALAATLVVVVGASFWMLRTRPALPGPSVPPVPAPVAVVPAPAPRLFAMSISPAGVRSGADSPTLVIPPGTDVVDLRLQGDAADAVLVGGRVAIRTVNGEDVWQGPLATASGLPAGIMARVEIPANRLLVDDYIVSLFAIDQAGAEAERHRYFLTVRAR